MPLPSPSHPQLGDWEPSLSRFSDFRINQHWCLNSVPFAWLLPPVLGPVALYQLSNKYVPVADEAREVYQSLPVSYKILARCGPKTEMRSVEAELLQGAATCEVLGSGCRSGFRGFQTKSTELSFLFYPTFFSLMSRATFSVFYIGSSSPLPVRWLTVRVTVMGALGIRQCLWKVFPEKSPIWKVMMEERVCPNVGAAIWRGRGRGSKGGRRFLLCLLCLLLTGWVALIRHALPSTKCCNF